MALKYAQFIMLASESVSSEVSGKGKKMSTNFFESSVIGGDHLSTFLEKTLSKDKSGVLGMWFETI